MKASLLNSKTHSASLIEFAEECKKIIRSSFQYLVDEVDLPPLDSKAIKKAVDEGNQEAIFDFSHAAMVKCQQEIEVAINKLFSPEMNGIIQSSQVFAMLTMLITIAIQCQDIKLLRKDIAESDISASSDKEAFQGLLLGVLDTIYEMSAKKHEPIKEEQSHEHRVLN